MLVALAFAPLLYAFYIAVWTWWLYHNRIQGFAPSWVVEAIPNWLLIISELALFIAVTFAALLIGEVGMDILKSLRPLVLCLKPSSANTLAKLREQGNRLSKKVTELINELAPEMFPDCDAVGTLKRNGDIFGVDSNRLGADAVKPLPRNSSLHNLADIGFFSTGGGEGLRMSDSMSGEKKRQ